jgi:hypothetical protein
MDEIREVEETVAGDQCVTALILVAQAIASPRIFITDTLAPGGGKAVPQQAQGYRFITDTLAPGGGTSAPATPHGYRFITDTLAPGGGAATSRVDGPGFSWSAAGVGALTTIGVLLVLAGAALTAVRRRTVVTS